MGPSSPAPGGHPSRPIEEALDAERELLQTIIDRIPVMITLYEPGSRVLRVNREFERLTGWSGEDAGGTSLMEQCYPDPLYRSQVSEFMQSCRDGWMDIRMRTRDGRELETSWANVRLSDDRQVGIGIDIGERKAAERALRDEDRKKDEFVATLAHELRSPLAPIRSALEILRLAAEDRAARDRALAILDRQVEQMTRLVDDLLDLSRIRHGKLPMRPERVTLQAVAASAAESTRPGIEAGGLALEMSLPERDVWIDGDPFRLSQAIVNLLNNAAAHSRRGGAIRLVARAASDRAVIEVEDEGVGIPAEMLPRIFEMFVQGGSAAHGSKGLGVGLALTRAIVDLHGGAIEASSREGQGSRFVMRLPLAAEGERATAAEPPADLAERGAPLRVLVVDDNRDSAESLAMWLEALGDEARVAHEGRAAIEIARAWRPQLVLLDIGLPGMSGHEIARALRDLPELEPLLLVALSGWGGDADRARTAHSGFDRHLTKPADTAALGEILAEARGRAAAAAAGGAPSADASAPRAR
jgi:PAS domain S-box-containing protein